LRKTPLDFIQIFLKSLHEREQRNTECSTNGTKLQNVKSPLPRLIFANERLRLAKPFSDICLAKACLPTEFPQERLESLVVIAKKVLYHDQSISGPDKYPKIEYFWLLSG
jgi:hypothetical protein